MPIYYILYAHQSSGYPVKGIGFVMWEFGIGRDNCRFPWGSDTNPLTYEPEKPFHGVVYPDGHPWAINDVKALLGEAAFNTLPVFHVQYYKDNNFEELAKSSITPRIDFDLGNEKGTGSPDASAGIGEDNFSIRWTGTIRPDTTGAYTFYVDGDNIVQIWVGNTIIVDKTSNAEEASGNITLNAGQNYDVKIEYVHATGNSSLHVTWAAPGGEQQVLLPVYANKSVESVSLPSELNIGVDDVAKLPVTFNPADSSDQAVIWSSSNSSVASVKASNADGVAEVTGEKIGSAEITVTAANGKTAKCTVNVGAVANAPAIPDNATIDNFDSTTFDGTWQIVNESAANWSLTSNPGYLSINALQGDMYQTENAHHNVFLREIKANDDGDYEISLRLNATVAKNYQQAGPIIWQDQNNYIRFGRVYNGGKTLEFAKEINATYAGSGNINTASYPTGDRVYMKILKMGNTYTPYIWDGTKWVQSAQPITAELSNAKVGFYALGATDGTTVTANFDYFEVNPLVHGPATGVSLDKDNVTLGVGETYQLNEEVEPVTAADKTVEWSSDNESVATVDSNGLIKGIKAGMANITVTTNSGSFTATCAVNVISGSTLNNPIVQVGGDGGSADPWVIFKDGYYYYCKSYSDKSIQVAKAKRLQDIGSVPRITVWTPEAGQSYSKEIWAPELHYLDGKWYIYFAADNGDNANHRMYVLEADTDDPQGTYTLKGKITDSTNKWAIDGTVLVTDDGKKYFVWSGWEGDSNVSQYIYIAPMSDPWTISGKRVLLSKPEKSWELTGTPTVNEGPEILKKNGKIFIIYSASGSWTDDYCLGMLTYTGGDILNAASWTKSGPVFSKAPTAYGPGHASFTKSPDGTEDWIAYHADKISGGSWANRSVRAQKFTWNDDDTPNFGTPLGYGDSVPEPSGTPKVIRYKLEAENATLGGDGTVTTESNASGGRVVANLNNQGSDYVLFNAEVAQAGDYTLLVMGSCGVDGTAQDLTVNDTSVGMLSYANKGVVNFNPYWTTVSLNKGINTIKIAANTGSAEVDYIVLQALNDATEVPAAPSDLTAAAAGSSSIGLTWTAVTGATGYNVYRAASADGQYALIAGAGEVTENSYTDTGLTSGTTYYYKVSAVNEAGESDMSTAANATTNSDNSGGQEKTLQGITLDDNSYSLYIGNTHQTVVTAAYSDGSKVTVTNLADFVSADPSVATVSDEGLVKAVGTGSAVITAAYEGKTATVDVTVKRKSSSGGHHNSGGSTPSPTPTPAPAPTPVPTPAPEPAKKTFSDMDGYSWAKDAVEELAAKGVIKGTSEGTFDPGKNITRADFITLLVRALDLKADFDSNFADVSKDAYYYEALGIAKELGIAGGVGDNRFNPKAEISRQDMMVLVARALKAAGKPAEQGTASDIGKFTDASQVADYAMESVAMLVKEGIIQGSGNAINPKGTAIRAEAAVIIYRVYKK